MRDFQIKKQDNKYNLTINGKTVCKSHNRDMATDTAYSLLHNKLPKMYNDPEIWCPKKKGW